MADEDEEEILDSWEDALDSEVYYFYREYNLHLLISLTYVLATVSCNTEHAVIIVRTKGRGEVNFDYLPRRGGGEGGI